MNTTRLPETSSLRLRSISPEDLTFCNTVLPSSSHIETESEAQKQNMHILTLDGIPIGIVEIAGSRSEIGLKSFYLHDDYQGRGIGKKLLETFGGPQEKNLSLGRDVFRLTEDPVVVAKSRSSWSHITEFSRGEVASHLGKRLLFCTL